MLDTLPTLWMTAVFFMFGAIFGSFANVLIVRLPDEDSIVTPSHCRKCKARVQWRDNIPLISWLALRGRCRQCGEKFSMRYFWVELTMAVLFSLAFAGLGFSWFLLEFLIFIFMAVTASFIDLEHYILPDIFTLGGLALALVGAALNPERSFVDALIGFIVGGGFFYALAWIYFVVRKQEGMGGGDIKLIAWIGALLGWHAIPFVVFFSGFSGGIFGVIRSTLKRGDWQAPLPFGPFLVGAAILYVVGAQTIVQWYLQITGLG